ncbi:MAG: methyltransferase domain-containing protein [Solirubrobacterales bacterium]|nr:methyltransferase domain-containing protein [Solirubrobacterales bacterium]MBV9423304.1 methyltransferase domain-containing protein [Solirubrobacterales bacterium]MBV9797278.1 methyltransferase domain-containing protein [Solirubrobacterales bacterium]
MGDAGASDVDAQRAEMRDRWQRAASGWGRRAERLRDFGMPVSAWMIEHLSLQPGQRVLELAAGPGDTGFLAAELVRPGGVLLTSDGSEAMLEVARERAERLGIDNVEFQRLELEWIDLPAASVDAVLCRWGVMLIVDPAAGLREMRRVLRPGGRAALAVWDSPEVNPWATVPTRALVTLGHVEPPDPTAPGMFALAEPGGLQEMLEEAGFVDVVVDAVRVTRPYTDVDEYIEETLDVSMPFAEAFEALSDDDRSRVRHEIAALTEPFTAPAGAVTFTGQSLVAVASA